MNKKNLLVNRQYNIEGSWYAPRDFLVQNFKSVKRVVLWNTTSSAGDWTGYFVQTFGKKSYIIPFSQGNNYPRCGFSLNTGNYAVSYYGELSEEETNAEYHEWELLNGYA